MSIDSPSALARGSLRWYWNRMRVTNPMELPYRAVSAAGSLKDQTLGRLGMLSRPPRKTWVLPAPWLACAGEVPAVDVRPYLREADVLAAGEIPCVDGSSFMLGSPANWLTPRRTSPIQPALADVRFEMELHRHGHLVRLAQAWRLNGNGAHLTALLHQLESWLVQCPYPGGVAWSSALDAGLRLLNWSIVWQLLRADREDSVVPEALVQRWIDSVYVHARFIRQNRSRFSSANNHLLGELLGLVVAEGTWPVWPEVQRWGAAARREFSLEALKQTHEDGVNREQASWYQAFVFELMAVFVCVEKAQGHAIDDRIVRRMGAMARFVAALLDCRGRISHHGDADHTRALCVDAGSDDSCQRMLALAVDLGVAPELRALVDKPSAVSPWLVEVPRVNASPALATAEAKRAARSVLPRAFAQGGLHLLGSRFGEPDEVKLLMDTGPLGYLAIAAHGHADALSLRLCVGGQPILVDRGTCVYNAEPDWRHFFRSTLAHNTVCIDDTDQSVYGGPFLWLRHAKTQLDSFASSDASGHVDAQHNGYAGLRQPLVHRRRVEWHGDTQHFDVADSLHSVGSHQVAIAWHFDPGCVLETSGEDILIHAPGTRVRLCKPCAPQAGEWQLHHGDADSMLGWHSPSFGVRVPAPALIWRTRIDGTAKLSTRIQIETNEGRL